MAVDIASVCTAADANQSSQTLAVVLSIMFSLYTVVAIALSALTIYSTSQVATGSGKAMAMASGMVGSAAASGPPLVALRPGR